MNLDFESYTLQKSEVITKITGTRVSQKIKYINRKGTFKKTEQCKECSFSGIAQMGLGFAFDTTCDRDIKTWRSRAGETEKKCKFFKVKNEVK